MYETPGQQDGIEKSMATWALAEDTFPGSSVSALTHTKVTQKGGPWHPTGTMRQASWSHLSVSGTAGGIESSRLPGRTSLIWHLGRCECHHSLSHPVRGKVTIQEESGLLEG